MAKEISFYIVQRAHQLTNALVQNKKQVLSLALTRIEIAIFLFALTEIVILFEKVPICINMRVEKMHPIEEIADFCILSIFRSSSG